MAEYTDGISRASHHCKHFRLSDCYAPLYSHRMIGNRFNFVWVMPFLVLYIIRTVSKTEKEKEPTGQPKFQYSTISDAFFKASVLYCYMNHQ